MNRRHSENMFHVRVDMNLMVGHVTRDKIGTMITANVSVRNQYHIAYGKKIMFCTLVRAPVSVIRILTLVNT